MCIRDRFYATPLFLFVCYGLYGTFTCSGICLGSLSSYRQTSSVSDSAVAVDFNHSLYVKSDFSAKITFNLIMILNYITQICNLFFSKVLSTGIGIDTCCGKNFIRTCAAYTVNVGKGDLDALVIRNINTCLLYTSCKFTQANFHLS